MTNLSANERSFITLMAKSDEHARRDSNCFSSGQNF